MPSDSQTGPASKHIAAVRLRLSGHVQGVGYRPFVLRLARQQDIAGSVQNLSGEVEVIAEGPSRAVESFAADLVARAPPLARPCIDRRETILPRGMRGFVILDSAVATRANVFVPPDTFTCADCLRELNDPRDRRHRYPFINCTQCGPRYTLIDRLPYDRENTTMAEFPLCAACAREYSAPGDRRFHAEPLACSACGPQLTLEQKDGPTRVVTDEALRHAVQLLESGAVLAVKGIGGYHLLCDARQPAAVARLRERKRRPHKPLAVLFPQRGADGLAAVREHVLIDLLAAEILLSAARPIVLVPRGPHSTIATEVAPGLAEIGCLLPYSPLHHLLTSSFGSPLVATSGNVSGEPVISDNDEARTRLGEVADAFLHHDRRIARPADDSIVRVVRSRARVLRLGRGLAPVEMKLPSPVRVPWLAVGGHLKTTIALAWGDRAVISPHIGDMGTVRSEQVFTQVVADLQKLHGVHAEAVVCDAHPGYATTRWARECGLPVKRVQHHRAHASALATEAGITRPALLFAWDGAGFGDDGTLWGGETFFGVPGDWRRVASLRPFRLPGGESAGRAPWRSAAALCWEAGIEWLDNPAPPLALEAWRRNLNSPTSSAVGRLFDAAAAIILGVHDTTFEGQGPMWLEARVAGGVNEEAALPMHAQPGEILRIDWAPLVAAILDKRVSITARATKVHMTLARTIAEVARHLRAELVFDTVGLTGGVFQNRRLTEFASDELERAGFEVRSSERIPCNDGGLAFGQLQKSPEPGEMQDRHITLAHGNGGHFMRELIEEVFARHLVNPGLDLDVDAATLPWSDPNCELMMTTDGFTVQPLEFPGGDIGMLAVHGTVNDLAVSGAVPRYLTLNVFAEEGLEIALLERIVVSLAAAAREVGVAVVAGDTKVVRRGEGGGLYLATTGIGAKPRSLLLGMSLIQPSDAVLVSGPIGAHGIAVLLAREQFGLRGDLQSDAASVLPFTLALREFDGLRFMRDPTRGGLATVMHDIARVRNIGVRLEQAAIPVAEPVRAVCEILGYDPYYLPCEGRVVAVIAASEAQAALRSWHELPQGRDAAIIGHIDPSVTRVVLTTELGGARYLEELEDDPLPRIC